MSKKKDEKPNWGELPGTVIGLCKFMGMELLLHEAEDGDIALAIRPALGWKRLTDFREAELEIFHRFIHSAVELARPICRQRDLDADEQMRQGNLRINRLYRPDPVLRTIPKDDSDATQRLDAILNRLLRAEEDRQRREREHDQSLQERPYDVHDDSGPDSGLGRL